MMKITADENIPFVRKSFSGIGEVTLCAGREMTPERVREADILLVRSVTPVNETLLSGSRVTFVGTATIGIDHVDTAYLASRGIGFASAPGSNANSVAEYVMSALLEFSLGHEIRLQEKTLGIIGVGNVGSRVARKARALGMDVVLNDPPLRDRTGDARYRPLSDIMEADMVTVHVPLEREGDYPTFHLADADFFKQLAPGALFVNSSRGAVMETDALKKSLASGRIHAVLDVWENEPDIDTHLLDMVEFGTPHIAGYSFDGKVRGIDMIFQSACSFMELEPDLGCEPMVFLPESDPRSITVDGASGNRESVFRDLLLRFYDIRDDDRLLRGISAAEDPGVFFRNLRATYRIRREMNACEIHGINMNNEMEQALREFAAAVPVNEENPNDF